MWMKQPKLTNPLMAQRVMEDVNSQLTAKGWQLITENADVVLLWLIGKSVNGNTAEDCLFCFSNRSITSVPTV
jgi:hypothetical protein